MQLVIFSETMTIISTISHPLLCTLCTILSTKPSLSSHPKTQLCTPRWFWQAMFTLTLPSQSPITYKRGPKFKALVGHATCWKPTSIIQGGNDSSELLLQIFLDSPQQPHAVLMSIPYVMSRLGSGRCRKRGLAWVGEGGGCRCWGWLREGNGFSIMKVYFNVFICNITEISLEDEERGSLWVGSQVAMDVGDVWGRNGFPCLMLFSESYLFYVSYVFFLKLLKYSWMMRMRMPYDKF